MVILCMFQTIVSYSSIPALLLEKEPSNLQAQSLAQLIEKGVARGTVSSCISLQFLRPSTDGYIGMAIVGGAAALGTLVLAGLIRRATRK